MVTKEFLSTGEAAEILNISRDTVIRKFDKGILTGKQNPLTGKRYISRESLEAFMKQYGLPLNGLDLAEKRPAVAQAFGYERRWPRKEVDLPASINFYSLEGSRQHNPGIALVRNISQGGAFISQIYLERRVIPGEAFRAFLKIDHQPLIHWMARSKVVRLQANGSLEAGVQFVRISKQNLEKIEKIFS